MPYGTIKVDTITFTSGSSDVSVAISGLVQNPTFSGDVTVTGTVSGTIVRGNTVSGATVTGTAGQFGTLTGNTAGFTTVTGTTVTGTTANFATVSGTTVTGATAQFTTTTGVSGVFTSQLSGAIVTGDTFQGSNITGVSGVFTTRVSGATVTGNAIVGSTITGVSGVFTTVISGASGVIAGNITASAFIPTGSAVPTNGVYLPSANTVGIAANSSGILFATSSGVGIGTTSPKSALHVHESGSTVSRIRLTNSTTTDATAKGLQIAQNGVDLYITNNENGAAIFSTSGTEQVKITSSGQLLVGVTSANANGGVLQLKSGITFPATAVASTDANTLDDYEEGTWTATLTFGNSATGSLNYVANTGNYIKIGKLVYCGIFLRWQQNNYTANTGGLVINGLPFTTASSDDFRTGFKVTYSSTPWTGTGNMYEQAFRTETTSTSLTFNYADNADGVLDSPITSYTNISSAGSIMLFGCYTAAS